MAGMVRLLAGISHQTGQFLIMRANFFPLITVYWATFGDFRILLGNSQISIGQICPIPLLKTGIAPPQKK